MVKSSYSERGTLILFVMIILMVNMVYLASAEDNVLSSGVTPKIKIIVSNSTKAIPKINTTTANPVNTNNSSVNSTTESTNTIQNNTNSSTNQTAEQSSNQINSNAASDTNINTNNSSNNVIKVNSQKLSSKNSTEKQIPVSESKPGIIGAVISTEKNFDWNIILMFFSFILVGFIVLLLMYSYRKIKSDNAKGFSV